MKLPGFPTKKVYLVLSLKAISVLSIIRVRIIRAWFLNLPSTQKSTFLILCLAKGGIGV
jgi:hypothetical protein